MEEKTEGELQNLLSAELHKLSNWMILNQLTVNSKKCTIIVIEPTSLGIPKEFQLNLEEVCMKSTANVKYLKINLNQHLYYKSHIKNISKKFVRAIRIFRKLRNFCQQKHY